MSSWGMPARSLDYPERREDYPDRREDYSARREQEPSAAAAVMHELQSSMSRLERRIEVLNEAASRGEDEARQLEALRVPFESLEEDLGALRHAVRSRFESIEDHVTKLEASSAKLAEYCDAAEKRRASGVPAGGVSQRALLGHSMVTGVEDSRASLGSSSRAGPSAEGLAPRWSLRDAELEQRYSRRDSISPVRTARRRSRSPDSRQVQPLDDRTRPRRVERTATPDGSRRLPQAPRGSFVRPSWAAGVELQSEPLPEGRDFVSAVLAIKAAYQSAKIEPDQPIEVGEVANHLRKLDPTLLKRHNAEKWKDFIPLCQRYVAVFLVIPPIEGNIIHSKGDSLYIEDHERCYYARPTTPSRYTTQIEVLCQQRGIPVQSWLNRESLRSAAEAEPVRDDVSTKFPPLPGRLKVEPHWEGRLSQPETFWPIVDSLRHPPSPRNEVTMSTLHDRLQMRLGPNETRTFVGVTTGLKRMLGVASRFIKIGMLKRDPEIICLLNAQKPFHSDKDNEDYLAHVAANRRGRSDGQ